MAMKSFKEFLKDIAKHSLGVHRDDMPQIPKIEYEGFVDFVRNKGIIVEENISMPPNMLLPVQKTFKDKGIDELIEITDMSRAIIISKDYYILDGHHRYIVGTIKEMKTVLCTVINLNVEEALSLLRDYENGK